MIRGIGGWRICFWYGSITIAVMLFGIYVGMLEQIEADCNSVAIAKEMEMVKVADDELIEWAAKEVLGWKWEDYENHPTLKGQWLTPEGVYTIQNPDILNDWTLMPKVLEWLSRQPIELAQVKCRFDTKMVDVECFTRDEMDSGCNGCGAVNENFLKAMWKAAYSVYMDNQ